MPENTTAESVRKKSISVKTFLIAAVFGLAILCIVLAGLTIPIPGTGVVSDPREMLTTFGSALTGPIGGAIIGFFAGIAEPGGIPLASLLAHIMGCIWIGFAYKKLVFVRHNSTRYLFWIGTVIIYYYVFAISGFAIGLTFFYGGTTPILQLYMNLATGVIWELLLTIVVTTLIWIALPKKNRTPLW
jgi:hypothetical protein